MKILVINGSPKGKFSITLQTMKYLEKLYPEHEFSVLDAGQRIKALEKDFSAAWEAVEKAELIIFSYPVYTFVAPCQLHRFIELLKASRIDLSGKFATQLSTSKHFYDITAHNYIRDNCFDLGMKYIKGLSADMDDLLSEKGQKEAREFFDYVCWNVENGFSETAPKKPSAPKNVSVSLPENSGAEKSGDVVIITDCEPENKQLSAMISRFCTVLPRKTRVVNLRDFPFSGGCLGCFGCAVSGKCVYKDGFDDFLRNELQTGEAIVYAFTVKDHSMGALFKMYDDRQFCNGHRTVTMGMPFGYLVSGNLSEEENLRMIIEARAQVGGNFLAGIATDESDPDYEIDRLAKTLSYAIENKYVPPQNFYGIGGMKIFRDLIWQMQGMMKADHKFYKSHGQYDFPQKKWPRMLAMYAVGAMIGNPKIKAKMGNRMNEGMLMPYKKLLDKTEKR
ncbi:MAG: NAD(P)H-dependent oxidoreductase [Oscillospiraceae bacterium]|nr:NAD(P)H-dependent oxidoreductase [Oscillospiraceae bacterium]